MRVSPWLRRGKMRDCLGVWIWMQPYTPLRILPRGRSTISRGAAGGGLMLGRPQTVKAFFELGRELFDEFLLGRHVVRSHAWLTQPRL
jgi:hypothetical protein